MQRFLSWLLAGASLLGLVGTSRADLPLLTPLLLPQLFGQETPVAQTTSPAPQRTEVELNFSVRTRPVAEQLRATPHKVAPSPSDDDACWDCLDFLVECAPSARMVLSQLRPTTPYHVAAAAILEYFSALEAAQHATPFVVQSAPDAPACCKDGPCKSCAILPCPKQGEAGCFVFGIGPNGPFAFPCQAPYGCTKTGYDCGTYAPCPVSGAAEACDNIVCCEGMKTLRTASKACMSCEQCDDCKDGTCTKNAAGFVIQGPGVVLSKERIGADYLLLTRPHSGLPYAMPPLPMHPPVPVGFPLPPYAMPPLPHSPFGELVELNRQREMICAAIEQIEHELAVIECQQRVVMQPMPMPMPVAHNAHKVHLVTDHFEAHCEAVSCVGGDSHRLLLQGDVRLTSKKSGHAVRIEAPCVVINMKDGTFTVESLRSVAPSPVQSVIYTQPLPPTMPWQTGVPAYTPAPGRTAPMPMPSPVAPRGTAVPQREIGDK